MKLKKRGPSRIFTVVAAAALLIVFSILAAGQADERGELVKVPDTYPADEGLRQQTVPVVPIADEWMIEFGLAPLYESSSGMTQVKVTSPEKSEEPSRAKFFFDENGNIKGYEKNWPGAYRAVAETRTIAPGGVTLSCKEERKCILEAKVVGGKVDLKKKPPQVITIELWVMDYVAENKKTCRFTPPGFSQTTTDRSDGSKAEWWWTGVYGWPLKNGHSEVIGSFKYTLYHKNTYCDEQRRRDLAEAQELFNQKVAACIKKSGVVTRCNTNMLSRCVQADYKENTKMKSFDGCIESALIDGWEEGLANCIKGEMEWYNLRLTVIDERYKWCMGH